MVAGEASGDLHGAHLLEAIRQIDPDIQFFGMGGEALRRTGMNLLYHHQSLSVVGITEVLLKLRSIRKALRGLKQALDLEKPDLVILIDFPDFNLRLAKFASPARDSGLLLHQSPGVGLEARKGKTDRPMGEKDGRLFPLRGPHLQGSRRRCGVGRPSPSRHGKAYPFQGGGPSAIRSRSTEADHRPASRKPGEGG